MCKLKIDHPRILSSTAYTKMSECQAKIQQGSRRGELCRRETNTKYCEKHQRQEIVDKSINENIRYCDISRGCYTILEDHQSKCTHCLHKAKISDRKREDKKRQDANLCLDCGNTLNDSTRAKGKHDKSLRRCIPCYEKMLKIESKRVRERNYKAEAFTNKYVVWNHYVKGAKKRNIDFKLSKDIFNSLIILPCFYCNYQKNGEVNGIDRLDNNTGYIENNVVSCCQMCNSAKGAQHPQEFIDKLYLIHNHSNQLNNKNDELLEKWKNTYLSKTITKFSIYAKSANSRNIEFKLNENEFNSITSKDCYLCGLKSYELNSNGIDRIKNNIGYITTNCAPCCGHCNLLKKDLSYEIILEMANNIYSKYTELTNYFNNFDIKPRESKIEERVRVINPEEGLVEKREYKSLNEIILPKEIHKNIESLLEKKDKDKEPELKQWKTKQIYEAISTNTENNYKEYCEKNNDISKIPDWDIKWTSFVLSVREKPQEDSEKLIKDFVKDLRRIRHNELCYNNNAKVIDRDDRQQWPATTIVRAYLDNKMETFKEFTEGQNGDNPNDPTWQKRWNTFIKSLDDNKENEQELKTLCSKFLTAQRIKRYRKK
jgi:hypothetical protein